MVAPIQNAATLIFQFDHLFRGLHNVLLNDEKTSTVKYIKRSLFHKHIQTDRKTARTALPS